MLATLLALAVLAQQGQPDVLGNDIRYARSGKQQEGEVTYFYDQTKTYPVQCDGSAATWRACCFPWGSQVVATADKPATLCWSMTSSVTLGAYAGETAHVITDANKVAGIANGNGPCVDIVAGQTVNMIPSLDTLRDKPGSRYYQGICTGMVTDRPTPGTKPHAPCRVDADCTLIGAGTCDTSLDDADYRFYGTNGCGFLVGRGSANTIRVTTRVER